jgi:hypothetical protein
LAILCSHQPPKPQGGARATRHAPKQSLARTDKCSAAAPCAHTLNWTVAGMTTQDTAVATGASEFYAGWRGRWVMEGYPWFCRGVRGCSSEAGVSGSGLS